MATIFEQALKELDEVKRGLSKANPVLFKGAIQAAEKAEDALKAFQSASSTAKEALGELLNVQSILEGKSAGSSRGPGKGRTPSDCLKCVAEGSPVPPRKGLGGRVGRFCKEHMGISQAEKDKLKKKAA